MTPGTLAGGLRVAARWHDGVLSDWQIQLVRPPVAQTLVGLAPAEAAEIASTWPWPTTACSRSARDWATSSLSHSRSSNRARWKVSRRTSARPSALRASAFPDRTKSPRARSVAETLARTEASAEMPPVTAACQACVAR